jgi:inorganic pyrophosphatase
MSHAAIAKLDPYDEHAGHWRVVVETPKGSHNKYRFDERLGLFLLDGVLPEGMSFPYDFGFLPGTLGDDGDPLDVLLLMDQPAFCGCVVPSRLIGVIEAEQTERDGTGGRNDRLVAVPIKSRVHNDALSLLDLNRTRVHEISEFFVSYNRVRGKGFDVLGVHGPERASSLARQGIKQASRI